jgi:hypothetical protein
MYVCIECVHLTPDADAAQERLNIFEAQCLQTQHTSSREKYNAHFNEMIYWYLYYHGHHLHFIAINALQATT